MPAMDTVLFNDPEVKGLALAILEECVDLREFGRRMLELVANAAMSAIARSIVSSCTSDPAESATFSGVSLIRLSLITITSLPEHGASSTAPHTSQ